MVFVLGLTALYDFFPVILQWHQSIQWNSMRWLRTALMHLEHPSFPYVSLEPILLSDIVSKKYVFFTSVWWFSQGLCHRRTCNSTDKHADSEWSRYAIWFLIHALLWYMINRIIEYNWCFLKIRNLDEFRRLLLKYCKLSKLFAVSHFRICDSQQSITSNISRDSYRRQCSSDHIRPQQLPYMFALKFIMSNCLRSFALAHLPAYHPDRGLCFRFLFKGCLLEGLCLQSRYVWLNIYDWSLLAGEVRKGHRTFYSRTGHALRNRRFAATRQAWKIF